MTIWQEISHLAPAFLILGGVMALIGVAESLAARKRRKHREMMELIMKEAGYTEEQWRRRKP